MKFDGEMMGTEIGGAMTGSVKVAPLLKFPVGSESSGTQEILQGSESM